MNKKGVVLIVSLMIMSVFLVLTGVYFSSLLTEKKAADTEEFILQALGLAEAGANQAQAELRERIRTDLLANVQNVGLASTFQNYVNTPNSLGFLSAFALAVGDNQFVVSGGEATLAIVPINLNTGVQGNYNADIIVTANGNPTNPQGETFVFPYNYRIESQGTITRVVPNITKRARLTQGSFTVTVRRDTFAKFALFTTHHKMPSGTTVWFTANTNFTGPVQTNERFSFANNPSAHFSADVAQHLSKARFYNSGSSKLLDADRNPVGCCPQCIQCTAWSGCCEGAECTTCCVENSACSNKPSCVTCKDYPVFDAEFTRGSDLINLPSSVTQGDLLNQATGNRSPGAFTTNGIYIPNEGGVLDGGIYIRGNSSNLTMGTDAQNRPVYIITQSTNTKQITIEYPSETYPAGRTIVTNVSGSGGTPVGTYNGIPNGVGNEGIIIYDNGSISNFSGKVQSDTKVTVSSDSDIVINPNPDITVDNKISYDTSISTDKHIRYQSYNSGPPPDALGYTNLLGILSWNGDVRIGQTAPDNINIHGVVMAPHGVFSVDNYNVGSPRGTTTLLGGVISDFYGAFGTFSGSNPVSGYGRNFVYDPRVLGGTVPPYFPYMANFTSTDDNGLDRKLVWQDQGV